MPIRSLKSQVAALVVSVTTPYTRAAAGSIPAAPTSLTETNHVWVLERAEDPGGSGGDTVGPGAGQAQAGNSTFRRPGMDRGSPENPPSAKGERHEHGRFTDPEPGLRDASLCGCGFAWRGGDDRGGEVRTGGHEAPELLRSWAHADDHVRSDPSDEVQSPVWNQAMHWGTGAVLGALRGSGPALDCAVRTPALRTRWCAWRPIRLWRTRAASALPHAPGPGRSRSSCTNACTRSPRACLPSGSCRPSWSPDVPGPVSEPDIARTS
jgi:hypothetical protein